MRVKPNGPSYRVEGHRPSPQTVTSEQSAPQAAARTTRPVDTLVHASEKSTQQELSPVDVQARMTAVRSQLGQAASRATGEYALRRVAARSPELKAAVEALRKDASFSVDKLPDTADGLAEALTTRLCAKTPSLGKEAVHDAVLDELTVYRYGKRQDQTFRLVDVTPSKQTAGGPRTHGTPGYLPEVEGLKLDGESSLHDVQSYIDDRLGSFVLTDLVTHRRVLEFHQSSSADALASLRARGFTQVLQVAGPKSNDYNQLFLVQHGKTGELRYAMAEISGTDRLAHMQKLVASARVPGLAGELRVDNKQVLTFTDPLVHPEDVYRRYSRALLASGTVPPQVVVGFKSGIMRELGRRAVAARQLEHVQGALGKDPLATLTTRAQQAGEAGKPLRQALEQLGAKARVLSEQPSMVFRFQANIATLRDVEAALATAAKADPKSAALLADVVGDKGFKVTVNGRVAESVPDDTFVDQSVITYVDQGGTSRSLLVTRNPYGDLAHEMGRVLVDNGVENIFVVGTAGGLDQDGKVGDIHAPGKVVGADGKEIPFDNKVLSLVMHKDRLKELGGRVKVNTTLTEVNSPLDETKAWVDRMKTDGYQLVEMELADLLRATQGSGTAVSGLYVISDMPGTQATLEQHTGAQTQNELQRVGDLLVEQLGISDVKLVSDARAPAPTGFPGALALADRAMQSRGLAGGEYALMRYTLGRYLYNGLSDQAIAALVADTSRDPFASPQLASRWKAKAERELKAPFKNDAVVNRLRELGDKVKDAVGVIGGQGGKPGDYKLHILGSIVKGRAGAGSDVDVLVETPDKALAQRIFESRYGYLGAPADSPVVIGGYEYAMSRGSNYGPIVNLGDGSGLVQDRDLLVGLYAKAVAEHGIDLKRGDDGKWTVKVKSGDFAPPQRETEEIAEKVLEYEKAYRDYMNSDFILRHLKDTAPLADVSHLPFNRLVARGEALIKAHLRGALTAENLRTFVASPDGERLLQSERGQAFLRKAGLRDGAGLVDALQRRGLAGLPLAQLVNGEMATALVGLGDPLDALAVDLAAAERARRAHEKSGGKTLADFAFFPKEVRDAQRKPSVGVSRNPVLARIAHEQDARNLVTARDRI